jgi:hypothetical protein
MKELSPILGKVRIHACDFNYLDFTQADEIT